MSYSAESRHPHTSKHSGIEPVPKKLKRLYESDTTTLLNKINSFAELKGFERYYYNTYRAEPLHHAIRCSNIDVAKTLILRGADPNKEDRYFHTPLYYALKADNEAIVSLLLSNNVSATSIFNEYRVGIPTYYFEYVCENSNTKILELFLNNGCTANDDLFTHARCSCERKCRPLHAAIMKRKIETVKILINYGADVNAINLLLETPLHLACMEGLIDIVVILLNNNALVNVFGMNNKTPLCQAIRSCDPHIVKLLLENGAVIDNNDPETIRNICYSLDIAIENGVVEIVKYLLDAGLNPDLGFQGSTFLQTALKFDKLEILELLLKYGADMDRRNNIGCTPLHMAATRNKMELMKILLDRDSYLKDSIHKSVIDVKDRYGGTALQVACVTKSPECAYLLMDYGADLTSANDKGDTALHLATESSSISIVKRLVNAKVPINVVNEYLNSPLHIAVMNNSAGIVEFLLKNKATTVCENNDRLIPLEVVLKQRHTADVMVISHLLRYAEDINDSYHRRAFRLAMNEISEEEMAIEVFDLFFKYGFTLNPTNDDINLLLYIAARNGHTTIVQMLLNLGANPNTKINMESVLHATVKQKHLEIISMLLKHGADKEAINMEYELALHNAIENGNINSFSCYLHDIDAKVLPELLHHVLSKCPRNYSGFVELLVEHGVNVNAFYAGSNILVSLVSGFCTALTSEVKNLNERMLWDYGMDLRRRFDDPFSMFSHTTEMYRCFSGIEVLLSYGADMHIRDSHGTMALERLLTRLHSETSGNVVLPKAIMMCKVHVTKLRLAGLYVHPKIMQHFEQLSLVDVEQHCLRELERLKMVKLNGYVSAYDLLTKNLTQVTRLTRSPDGLWKRVNRELDSGNYPLYGNQLICQLARAQKCDLYMPHAEDTLRRMCEKELPDICIEKIMGYLDLEDFRNLMKSGEF